MNRIKQALRDIDWASWAMICFLGALLGYAAAGGPIR